MSNLILFLGPRIGKYKKLGGVVVLFEDLLSFSNRENINYIVIDTNLENYSNKFIGLINVLFSFFINFKKVNHVSLHGTARDFFYLAPIFVSITKIFKKKISLRKFAGSFYEIYSRSNFFKKIIIRNVLKNSDYLFFETKFLVKKFRYFNNNTFWWPNSRPKTNLLGSKFFKKKFVFISQVKKTKGIYQLIEAASKLDNSYEFDIFGPILCNEIKLKISKVSNVNYKGILNPEKVVSTLAVYDVLVLPRPQHQNSL